KASPEYEVSCSLLDCFSSKRGMAKWVTSGKPDYYIKINGLDQTSDPGPRIQVKLYPVNSFLIDLLPFSDKYKGKLKLKVLSCNVLGRVRLIT
ncbi:MAG: hypothetical protein ACK5NY_02540, partial [Burkholderiaceae bacterium]